MKRRTLVQSISNRRLVSPDAGSGQQPLTSMQKSGWARPLSTEGTLDRRRAPSTPTTAPVHAAQNPN